MLVPSIGRWRERHERARGAKVQTVATEVWNLRRLRRQTRHVLNRFDAAKNCQHMTTVETEDVRKRFDEGNANESAVPSPEVDFCIELARPETIGGIVLVLQHPDPSQIFGDGYAVEEMRCTTLAAVKELVQFGSGGTRGTGCVTTLDCMPFVIDDYNESGVHRESQETFLRALEAKRLDVVISCFRTKTPNTFLRLLVAARSHDQVSATKPNTAELLGCQI